MSRSKHSGKYFTSVFQTVWKCRFLPSTFVPDRWRKIPPEPNGKMNGIAIMEKRKTAAELAAELGRGIDAMRKRWKVNFPGIPFSAERLLSAEEISALTSVGHGNSKRKKQRKSRIDKAHVVLGTTSRPVVSTEVEPAPLKRKIASGTSAGKRQALLVALLIAPTVASVWNVYRVSEQVSENWLAAALLTVVLSVTALGFVLAGIRRRTTVALALLLIAYEAFCNLTRIYDGLMHDGVHDCPTRFLGLVTDIFNTGSHGTAIALGALTALLLAAVQYATISEVNKLSNETGA